MQAISVFPETDYVNEPPQLINGSQALMRALVAEGVDTIFGYPGGAIMPV